MEKYKEKNCLAYIAEDTEKAAINEEARTIRFVISSNELDRDNEIVEPSAVAAALKEFSKNPVCLACHQHRLSDGMPPVVGAWDTDSFKELKSRCEMDLRFAETELAETYWQLYKGKFMKAVSIGFRVLEFREEMKDGKRYWIITKIELYEISCVPVGANRDALSKVKGLAEPLAEEGRFKDLELTLTKTIDSGFTELSEKLTDSLTAQIDEIKDLLIADPEGMARLGPLGAELDPSGDGSKKLGAEQTVLNKILKVITDYGA